MGLTIQKPIGGPDVTRRNGRDILYVKGDDNTDGSRRFRKIDGQKFIQVEARENGVFNLSGLKTGGSSVEIGESLSISATGSFIRTRNLAEINPELFALIPEIPFDPDGTDFLVTPFLSKQFLDPVFPGPTTSEIVNTTIGQICPVATGRVVETITHEAGSLSANSPVQYSIFVGTDNTGPLLFRANFPASSFVNNQPVVIFLNSSVEFEAGANIFLEMTSSTSFSLDTNALGNVITLFDVHALKLEGVITENLVYNDNLDGILNNDLDPVYANQF